MLKEMIGFVFELDRDQLAGNNFKIWIREKMTFTILGLFAVVASLLFLYVLFFETR